MIDREAIVEDLPTKRTIFEKLEPCAKKVPSYPAIPQDPASGNYRGYARAITSGYRGHTLL